MKKTFLMAIMAFAGVCAMAQESAPNTVMLTKTNGERLMCNIDEVKDITFVYYVDNAPADAQFVQLYADGPKWANMNVGAEAETEYGSYFWWGGTTGHPSVDSYLFNASNTDVITYGMEEAQLQSAGIIGADGNLTAAYDAATVNWGTLYRMPTQAEYQALIDNCTWTWEKNYKDSGKNGYVVTGTGDYAGNSIFIPANGFRVEGGFHNDKWYGNYWVASPSTTRSNVANLFRYDSTNGAVIGIGTRYYGYGVRPVKD